VTYSHPPNLELDCHGRLDKPCLLDQKEDHFRIRINGPFPTKVCWKARGTRGCPGSPCAPVLTPTPPQTESPPTAGIKASGPETPETAPKPTPVVVP
jgi:hypothetical protein